MRRLFDDDSVVLDKISIDDGDSPYQMKITDRIVYADSSSGSIIVYVPDVVEAKGRTFTVEAPFAGSNSVFVNSKGKKNPAVGWLSGLYYDYLAASSGDFITLYSDGERYSVIDSSINVQICSELHVRGPLLQQRALGVIGTGNKTITSGTLLYGILDEDPEGNATWTLPTAALLVNQASLLKGVKVGDTFQVVVHNRASAASGEVVTLAAGAGGTLFGTTLTLTEGTNTTGILMVRLTNVTSGSEAYEAYLITNA